MFIKKTKKKQWDIFCSRLLFLCLFRSQLISLQGLEGPSATMQPFTHAISLKTTLSPGNWICVCVSECVCKSISVSLQFAYIIYIWQCLWWESLKSCYFTWWGAVLQQVDVHASATTLTASAHATFYFLLICIFGLRSAYTECYILPCKNNLGGILCPNPLRQSGGGIQTANHWENSKLFDQESPLLSL